MSGANPKDKEDEKSKLSTVPKTIFKPQKPYEIFLADWMKKSFSSDLVVGETSQANSYKHFIEIAPATYRGGSTLLHEASHIWYRLRILEFDHPERPVTIELRDNFSINRIISDLLAKSAQLESLLHEDEMAKMSRALGRPETYLVDDSGKPFRKPFQVKARSWIGNIVDESATIGLKQRYGHPMQNYGEFFSSFMVTMSYDGDTFFRLLGNFKGLSKKSETASPIFNMYKGFSQILEQAREHASQMLFEMKEFEKTHHTADRKPLERLEANLARLEALQRHDSEQKQAPEKRRQAR